MSTDNITMKEDQFARLLEVLERIAPEPKRLILQDCVDACVWNSASNNLVPVKRISRIDIELLQGIESQRDKMLKNTRSFLKGKNANNALLWGARGTGKSSLVKAVHAEVNRTRPAGILPLVLVEIQREDLHTLNTLMAVLLEHAHRQFILYCDDLSFDDGDSSYKSLKAILDGGIMGRPDNVVFYATSNRRHLMPREMIENERSTAIHAGESTEEKVSLSDRFGLWIGFHNMDQREYLQVVDAYVQYFDIPCAAEDIHRAALEWSMQRGTRSGRTAWQFIQDIIIQDSDDERAKSP